MKKLTNLFILSALVFAVVSCSSEDSTPQDTTGTTYTAPSALSISLSTTTENALMSATAAPDGGFWVAGYIGTTGSRKLTVAKLTSSGAFDTSFNGTGIKELTDTIVGGNDEIDIATQSDGKLVLSATQSGTDNNILVVRLKTDGDYDGDFGTGGKTVLDLNGNDNSRAIAINQGNGLIYIHGTSIRPSGTDTDFVVVRLTTAGVLDGTFGTGGKFQLDIDEKGATARGIHVLSDGKVIAGGYANTDVLTGGNQAVLYKLTTAGVLDTDFVPAPGGTLGIPGIFYEVVLADQTEVYNFAVHGSNIVTAGYGGAGVGSNWDWVSLKFDANTGARDTTWGGAANGAVIVDPHTTQPANCRNAFALPGGKTILLGSAGSSPGQSAAFAVLDADGRLDSAYGSQVHHYSVTSNNENFWGGAVSGNNALLVGFKNGGATPDGLLVLVPLQ